MEEDLRTYKKDRENDINHVGKDREGTARDNKGQVLE